MPGPLRAALAAIVLVLLPATAAWPGAAPEPPPLAAAERAFADWLDGVYAVSTLEAGPMARLEGRDLGAWRAERAAREATLRARLARLVRGRLTGEGAAAAARMRQVLADAPHAPAAASAEDSEKACERAPDPALGRAQLSAALYGCFERWGNHLDFEDRTLARATALELLGSLDEAARRKALFDAFAPLWAKIDAADEPASPYRRLIALAAAEDAARGGSPVGHAAATLGLTDEEAEADLVAALEAWRAANPGPALEPWDYWSRYALPARALDARTPPARMQAISFAFYRDLGVDLARAGVISDLAVRPGKAPPAYTDFVRIGRAGPNGWRPARVRVSANVEHGGLMVLNEIVHEDGHAAHMLALRARPAFYDLGDDLFVEAFADVASWSVAEPRWQGRYLGASLPPRAGQSALLANVMLDMAWGLFELRMLRAPDTDPNAAWTDITSRYLNIRPHPELAWWALRVQLVDQPGYMINYGLGAMLTADLRARLRQRIGDFDAGDPRWGPLTARRLLRWGAQRPTPALLRAFLGRPVSIAPLIEEIRASGPGADPKRPS